MRTWLEIKRGIEAAGVQDADPVFLIDIGPGAPIEIDRDEYGYLEIFSDRLLEQERQGWSPPPLQPSPIRKP